MTGPTAYQVYVHLGVAQGAPAAVAGDHPLAHLAHRLLCYQVNGKVLIHLEREKEDLPGDVVLQGGLDGAQLTCASG